MVLDLIKKYEGLASKNKDRVIIFTKKDIENNLIVHPYTCMAGKRTIGWGSVLKEDKYSDGISVADADEMLEDRVVQIKKTIALELDLSGNQASAVTSLCYNIGINAFLKSTLFKKIKANKNDLVGIKKEWLRWSYIKNVKSNSLLARRSDEFEIYTSSADKKTIIKNSFNGYIEELFHDFIDFII